MASFSSLPQTISHLLRERRACGDSSLVIPLLIQLIFENRPHIHTHTHTKCYFYRNLSPFSPFGNQPPRLPCVILARPRNNRGLCIWIVMVHEGRQFSRVGGVVAVGQLLQLDQTILWYILGYRRLVSP